MNQYPKQHHQAPSPSDSGEFSVSAPLHDVEVVARSLDMVPSQSDLGKYLAAPEKALVKGSDGNDYLQETGLTNYDRFKQETIDATEKFQSGEVSTINLLHGMVNADIFSHRDPQAPNLRHAFEDLHHMSITGSANFHTMLNPEGRTLGAMELGDRKSEVTKANAALFAKAAVAIRNGERAVMLNNYEGKPQQKMYGMTDPETGELLNNAFLVVGSGTFNDKDGTSSYYSNIAWANVILVPEEKIAAAAPEQQAEVAQVPDTKALDILRDGLPAQNRVEIGGQYSDTLKRSALVERLNEDGTKDGLTHLMFMGRSVLGVTRKLGADNSLIESKIVILPVGAQAEGSQELRAKPLLVLNADEAKKVRADGAIQDFEATIVGRNEIIAAGGNEDMRISRAHARMDLGGTQADVRLFDTNSTNGTQFMTVDTLMKHDFKDTLSGQSALALVQALQQKPELWLV